MEFKLLYYNKLNIMKKKSFLKGLQLQSNFKNINTKYLKITVIIINLAIIITTLCCIYKNDLNEYFKDIRSRSRNNNKLNKNDEQYYKYGSPLKNIVDEKNRILNVAFIIYPFTDVEKHKIYKEAKKKGMYFIGMSSYINFPCQTKNKYCITHDKNNISWTHNYFDLTSGWCHCFRDPNTCIPESFPKRLISESDFIRYDGYNYKNLNHKKKEYDFIYICLPDNDKCENGWQSEGRNWTLAKKCIDIMCKKYKMKGLLIGRINCELPPSCHTQKLIDTTGFLDYHKFIKQYQRCKFIFVPNIYDASPRVLTEALCHNLPCLVNYNIVGGWKYVNKKTGEFFTNEIDFEKALQTLKTNMYNNKYSPREYFINNHGPKYEGKELIKFIKEIIPDYKEKLNYNIDEIEYLQPVV